MNCQIQFVVLEDLVALEHKMDESDIVYRLRKRAEIRRQIPTRKSVQNREVDRLSDLLDEAAQYIESLRKFLPPTNIINGSNN